MQYAQCMLADHILGLEQTNLDFLVIFLCDFNKGNLSHKLPKYKQFTVTCPTREENILEHCYITVNNAHHTMPCATLGHSDCYCPLDSFLQAEIKAEETCPNTSKK